MSGKKKEKNKEKDNAFDTYGSHEAVPKTMSKKLSKMSGKDLEKLLEKDAKEEMTVNAHLMWYHARTNRALSETKLKNSVKIYKGSDGLFLIRPSAASSGDFVLSFIMGLNHLHHYVINERKPGWYSLDEKHLFQGLDQLVRHYSENASRLPVKLGRLCHGGVLPPPLSVHTGYTNILHATVLEAKEDSLAKVLECKSCPDINSRTREGSTALHLACGRGLTSIAKQLLSKGALTKALDRNGFTPLHVACIHGHCEIVKTLLTSGVDPQYRHSDTGHTALHAACLHNNPDCVKALLSFDVPAWPRDFHLLTPHQLAAKAKYTSCTELLDAYVPKPSRTSATDWFHENIDRKGAMALLEQYNMSDGHFLVRKNSKDPTNSVLVVSYNHTIFNYVIKNIQSQAYHIDDGPLLNSLPHLIEHYCMFVDGMEGLLTHAITPEGGVKRMAFTHPTQTLPPEENVPAPPPRAQPFSKNEPTVLDPASLTLEYEIGQGEYGSVMKGVWLAPDGSKVNVAVKTLHEEYLESGKESLIREAQVMVRIKHPCVVKLIGVAQGSSLMLVAELVELGALLDYLLDYPEKINVRRDMFRWASQIACGMAYLEEQGIVHRDLATRNILLSSPSQAKVADFGLSRGVGTSDYYRATKGGRWPIKWYAPEAVNYGTFSSASDVWSYGVTLWEMFSFGDQPYGDMTGAQVIQLLERNDRLSKPEKCPDEAYKIMMSCWEYKAVDRPTFKMLFEDFKRDKNYINCEPGVKQ